MKAGVVRVAKGCAAVVRLALFPCLLVCATAIAALSRTRRRASPREFRLGWGVFPAPKYKYWSQAMREGGWRSETVVLPPQHMNTRQDFDRFLYEAPGPGLLDLVRVFPRWLLGRYIEFLRALLTYDVLHHTFDGCFLGDTWIWWLERFFYRLAGIRSVVVAVGGDFFIYSRVTDPALLHALLTLRYELSIRRERLIARKNAYWVRHADVVIADSTLEGGSRWDVLPVRALAIDVQSWRPRSAFSDHDGRSGPVVVVHPTNHRGFKGTEFLLEAARQLRNEGLDIDLRILEGIPNREVQRIVREEGDILAEQFVMGYSLTAVEGMACALPVLSNLSNESRTRVFRRYSYLDECPILSTTPEQLRDDLRLLVTTPRLRRQLGWAGREYVEKYHSFEAARFLFSSIYEYLAGEPVDLLNLYHPLLGQVKGSPVCHPLRESRASHLTGGEAPGR